MSSSTPSLSGIAYLRLVGLGALIGVPAALLAAVFLAFVHEVEQWLCDDLPDALGASSPPWYLVIGRRRSSRRLLVGSGGIDAVPAAVLAAAAAWLTMTSLDRRAQTAMEA